MYLDQSLNHFLPFPYGKHLVSYAYEKISEKLSQLQTNAQKLTKFFAANDLH